MSKIDDARQILLVLGLPLPQQNDMAALTLLALSGLRPDDSWQSASRQSLSVTKGIIAFVRQSYGKPYAPNTRETFYNGPHNSDSKTGGIKIEYTP
jgi:hypothetical protein